MRAVKCNLDRKCGVCIFVPLFLIVSFYQWMLSSPLTEVMDKNSRTQAYHTKGINKDIGANVLKKPEGVQSEQINLPNKQDRPSEDIIIEKLENQKSKALAGFFNFVREVNPEFVNISLDDAQEKLFKLVTTFSANCKRQKRMGTTGDGGYNICLDEPFAPKKNDCLVYSFGIKDEWSFDDALYEQFGCEVHSFDPSMHKDDHMHSPGVSFHNLGIWGSDTVTEKNWKLKSLTNIISMLGHTQRTIDVLKIDVEGAEWPTLEEMLENNSIQKVKQMIFEIHAPKFRAHRLNLYDYGQVYSDVAAIESELGFRLYKENHVNDCCGRFAPLYADKDTQRVDCCYELFYLNSKLIKG